MIQCHYIRIKQYRIHENTKNIETQRNILTDEDKRRKKREHTQTSYTLAGCPLGNIRFYETGVLCGTIKIKMGGTL